MSFTLCMCWESSETVSQLQEHTQDGEWEVRPFQWEQGVVYLTLTSVRWMELKRLPRLLQLWSQWPSVFRLQEGQVPPGKGKHVRLARTTFWLLTTSPTLEVHCSGPSSCLETGRSLEKAAKERCFWCFNMIYRRTLLCSFCRFCSSNILWPEFEVCTNLSNTFYVPPSCPTFQHGPTVPRLVKMYAGGSDSINVSIFVSHLVATYDPKVPSDVKVKWLEGFAVFTHREIEHSQCMKEGIRYW